LKTFLSTPPSLFPFLPPFFFFSPSPSSSSSSLSSSSPLRLVFSIEAMASSIIFSVMFPCSVIIISRTEEEVDVTEVEDEAGVGGEEEVTMGVGFRGDDEDFIEGGAEEAEEAKVEADAAVVAAAAAGEGDGAI
jgi:hypothetical protein